MSALPYTVVDWDETLSRLDLDKAHADDAGFDLRAETDFYLQAGDFTLIRTGTRVAIPTGYCGLVLPRSGLSNKYGLTIPNSPGLIDAGFRGELMVGLYMQMTAGDVYAISNGRLPRAYEGKQGDRIAQLVIVEVATARAVFYPPDAFEALFGQTERGVKGFGSSGVPDERLRLHLLPRLDRRRVRLPGLHRLEHREPLTSVGGRGRPGRNGRLSGVHTAVESLLRYFAPCCHRRRVGRQMGRAMRDPVRPPQHPKGETVKFTIEELLELDKLADRIADAIARSLVAEVDDPIVRRLALSKAAYRFGLRREV